MPERFATVDDYRAELPPDQRAQVDALRTLVREAVPDAVEIVKWNSPNFTVAGEDRFTVNAAGRGPVRLILHHGTARAEQKDAAPSFDGDPHGLLTWHSDIRASLVLPAAADLASKRQAIVDVIRAWAARA